MLKVPKKKRFEQDHWFALLDNKWVNWNDVPSTYKGRGNWRRLPKGVYYNTSIKVLNYFLNP